MIDHNLYYCRQCSWYRFISLGKKEVNEPKKDLCFSIEIRNFEILDPNFRVPDNCPFFLEHLMINPNE